MKSFFLSATSVAVLLTFYVVADAQVQRGPAAGAAPAIGIVDISYIFKHHRRFQAQMEAMKTDAESTKDQILKEKERITKLMTQLKEYNPGTPNHNKLEEDITHQQAEFNAKAALQQKDFMERESRVYMTVYKEVSDAVAYEAQKRGMTLVLRFNGDVVDGNNRESVLREINKPIVHYSQQADITPAVLDELNRGEPAPRQNGGTVPRAATRPGVAPRN